MQPEYYESQDWDWWWDWSDIWSKDRTTDITVNVTITITCPKCKSAITYNSNIPYCYCPYCGYKLSKLQKCPYCGKEI